MRPSLLERLQQQVGQRAESAGLRQVLTSEQLSARHVVIHRRRLLNFSSNDYLGLATHPQVISAARQALTETAGSGASHLVTGHHRYHQALQEALADWLQRPAALLFSCGYMANLGVIQTLCQRHDLLLQDRLNHASLIDAARLSGARLRRYHHNDANHAATLLEANPERAAMIATDGVFSMDGDIAPLSQLAQLCQRQHATLMVDDAHGLGVMGDQGRGSTASLDTEQVPVLMGTLGKALGGFGAFVTGSSDLIEGLTQFARSHIYTTATPPACAAASLQALQLSRNDEALREQLQANVAQLREQLAGHPKLRLMASDSPIQPILVGDSQTAVTLSEQLFQAGLRVVAIRPPTVPQGQARLRITLSAAHRPEDIQQLADTLLRLSQ